MLPLGGTAFPESRAELESALRAGLGAFAAPKLRVEVEGDWPKLDRIAIDLSDGELPARVPPIGNAGGEEIEVREFAMQAKPLRYENASVNLEVQAQGVKLELQRSAIGEPVLAIKSAETGLVNVTTERQQLEKLIHAVAVKAAQKHGVSIDRTTVRVTPAGPRSVDFTGEIVAQKLFMKTIVRVGGKLTIDHELNARLSGLSCEGAGLIGGLACNFLQPYLDEFARKPFPLASFALGELRVVEVTLDAAEPLRVTAKLGATC